MALGQRVEVEQQLLTGQRGLVGRAVLGGPRRRPVVGVGHRDPAAGAVLLPLEGAAVVPVAAVAGRHGQVGLAGAGLDLLEDRLAQLGQVRGLRLGVGVLRLEVRRHLGRALVAQPLVVVDAGPAVVLGGDGTALAAGGGTTGGCLGRRVSGVLHRSEPDRRALGGSPRPGVDVRPQAVDSHVEKPRNLWSLPRTPVEQSVGPEECRTFFDRTPCARLRAGHRTLPPINQRPSRNGDRGSGRNEDPHHEATRGVGPVTGSAGSESLPGRGGRHPASSLEGLLVLIPSRGPHPCFRSGVGPAGSRAGTESQPACRRGRGSRVADGFRGGVGKPETQPARRRRIGPRSQPVRRRRHGTRVIEGFGRR